MTQKNPPRSTHTHMQEPSTRQQPFAQSLGTRMVKAPGNKHCLGCSTAPGPLEWLQGHLGVQLWGMPHQSLGAGGTSGPCVGQGAAGTPEVPAEGQHHATPLLMMCTPKPRAPSCSHHPSGCRLLLLSLRGRIKPSGLFCSLLFRGSFQNTQLWATGQTRGTAPPPPEATSRARGQNLGCFRCSRPVSSGSCVLLGTGLVGFFPNAEGQQVLCSHPGGSKSTAHSQGSLPGEQH